MKLPIDGIQAFVLIAEMGSFHAAADALGLTQTALTRRIQRLEVLLGLTLLDRTTRSVQFSRVGREFLPLATRLIADLTHGIERLRTTSRLSVGDVTVATIQSVAFRQLPRALRRYANDYPQNRVQVLERSGALVTEAVRQAEADFGIHIQQEPSPDLIEDRLRRDPFVLICGKDHPLAGAAGIRWTDLRGVDLVTLGGASGNRLFVEAQLTSAGLSPARPIRRGEHADRDGPDRRRCRRGHTAGDARWGFGRERPRRNRPDGSGDPPHDQPGETTQREPYASGLRLLRASQTPALVRGRRAARVREMPGRGASPTPRGPPCRHPRGTQGGCGSAAISSRV